MHLHKKVFCLFFLVALLLASSSLFALGFVIEAHPDQSCTIIEYHGIGYELPIPALIDGYIVTAIGDGAFRDHPLLTTVYIPNTVTTIGENAFAGCTDLVCFNLPKSIVHIGERAFYRCTDRKSTRLNSSHL